MRKLILLATSVIVLSGTAEAACRLSDIAGTWRLQMTGSQEEDGDRLDLRADCRVTFNRAGRLTSMVCFPERNISMGHLLEDLDWEENTAPAQVGRNCWVVITLRNLYDTEGIFFDGHMTPDHGAILGAGRLFDDFGLVQFSMVRQS